MLRTETALERQRRRDDDDDADDIMALWFALLEETQGALVQEVTTFLGGNVALTALGDRLVDTLGEAHTTATVLGRRHAGAGPREATPDDEEFAASVMAEQLPYLGRMIDHIRDGRYEVSDEGELTGGLDGRLQLYVNRLRGTANEAWTFSLPQDTEVRWILGGCEHCPDCPRLAEEGPYTGDTLPSYPGDGSTACLSSCCCHLETEDGQEAFRLEPPS